MKNKLFSLLMLGFPATLILFFLILAVLLLQRLSGAATLNTAETARVFNSVKLTLITATVSSLLAIGFALPVAYSFSRYSFPLKKFIEPILYIPIVISPIALGAMLLIFFNTPAGRFIENNVCRIVFEIPGIIFAQFIVVIGFAVTLLKAVFDYINPEYEAVARTLGANRAQSFFYTLLPVAKNGILAAFLLTWARAVGEFGATVTLAGATPLKTETLPTAIFLAFSAADVQKAAILISISLGIAVTVLAMVNFLYKKSASPSN